MCKLCGDCTKSSSEHIAEVQREIAEAAAEMRVGYGDVRWNQEAHSDL